MEIKDLKQPYRRMAEYLARNNRDEFGKIFLSSAFLFSDTEQSFWSEVNKGNYPPITKEIKKHFPADFDFLGEEKPVVQMLDLYTQKYIYTQLAREGKFDELPDTCEFSEPVELEVWDGKDNPVLEKIIGKFKARFIDYHYCVWQKTQLPAPKINFSEFKIGDVVEVDYYGDNGDEKMVGYIYSINHSSFSISCKMTCYGEEEIILNQNIKKITKIK